MARARACGRVRVGRYEVDGEGFATVWRMRATRRRLTRDRQRFRHDGTPEQVAVAVLRANAGAVLSSGGSHFRAMWTADTGKAFGGALHALPHEYLEAQVARLIEEATRRRHVPVCVTPRGAHDIPWRRADGLPWLLHMAESLGPAFVSRHETRLRAAYDAWRARVLDDATGEVLTKVRGDWMDTVPRPSSTYNNLCALRAHHVAGRLSWPGAHARAERLWAWLAKERLRGDHLTEDATGSDAFAADAQVHALYLRDVPIEGRRAIADGCRRRALAQPLPVRARVPSRDPSELPWISRVVSGYHEAVWTHLGWMYCIGLERLGLPSHDEARKLEAIVQREGTFLETLELDGRPHASRFLATERDFTMSAGLYLEFIRDQGR